MTGWVRHNGGMGAIGPVAAGLQPRRSPFPFTGAPRGREQRPRRVVAVVNPASRWIAPTLQRLDEASRRLELGRIEVIRTTVDDPGVGQTRAALAAGAELVLAAGGDGTARLVAGELAGTGVPLGLLPIGSANLFARNLGLRPGPSWENILTALSGPLADVDLGQVACVVGGTAVPVQPMLVMAGLGRDAEAVDQVRGRLKRVAGWLAYAESGWRHMLAPARPVRCRLDGVPVDTSAWTVLAANCPRVLNHVVAFPGARLDDGGIEVLRLELAGPWQWPAVAAKGLLHFRASPAPLVYDTVRELHVTPAAPTPVQIDGDVVRGVESMTVTVRPRAVRVAVPRQLARRRLT